MGGSQLPHCLDGRGASARVGCVGHNGILRRVLRPRVRVCCRGCARDQRCAHGGHGVDLWCSKDSSSGATCRGLRMWRVVSTRALTSHLKGLCQFMSLNTFCFSKQLWSGSLLISFPLSLCLAGNPLAMCLAISSLEQNGPGPASM